MSNKNENKIEQKQNSTKNVTKKKKGKKKHNQQKEPIKNFEKILINEKENFNKSKTNLVEPEKIKIGER